jgi:hypothetical protein
VSAEVVLATCGLAAIVITLWIAAICRPAKPRPAQPYTPPPITDAYVDREFAVIRWHYEQEPTP